MDLQDDDVHNIMAYLMFSIYDECKFYWVGPCGLLVYSTSVQALLAIRGSGCGETRRGRGRWEAEGEEGRETMVGM